ncbi:hypothetical protein N0V88_003239 [Collariella sp. IMI 366227]|nr:hypothetical protein N0V88_003239 [Collariella sp. IMI 366227]
MHEGTLFHLVPANRAAEEALQHVKNARFVSQSAFDNAPGLEIGFHVPVFSHGHVMAKLGRDADLILTESFSGTHFAFQMQPETLAVLLSVRTRHPSAAVRVGWHSAATDHEVEGDCVLEYGRNYRISVASYRFWLIWRNVSDQSQVKWTALRTLAIKGYQDSLIRARDVDPHKLSLVDTSTAHSFFTTRIHTANAPLVIEEQETRELIGQGSFGNVFKSRDQRSGHYFAVKSVNLRLARNVERVRACLYREVSIMKELSHPHIVKCLGTNNFDTDEPLVFMPLSEGSLASLVGKNTNGGLNKGTIPMCDVVLKQMLSALDYLAFHKLCHRDLKPDNILYVKEQGQYLFQLADFGFANRIDKANTVCGSPLYWAPEVYLEEENHTPKVDIWSLFVSIIEIHPNCNKFPPHNIDIMTRHQLTKAVLVAADDFAPELLPMAKLKPEDRASAAQMLLAIYNGEGLTTSKHAIKPLGPAATTATPIPAAVTLPAPQPSYQTLVQLPNARTRQRAAGKGRLLTNLRPFGERQKPPALFAKPAGIQKPAVTPLGQAGFAQFAEQMRRERTPAETQAFAPKQGLFKGVAREEQAQQRPKVKPEPQTTRKSSPGRTFKAPSDSESPMSTDTEEEGVFPTKPPPVPQAARGKRLPGRPRMAGEDPVRDAQPTDKAVRGETERESLNWAIPGAFPDSVVLPKRN